MTSQATSVGRRSQVIALPAVLRASGVVAAAAWTLLAVVQLTNPTFDDQLTSAIDYVNDSTFTLALITSAIAGNALHLIGRPRVVPVRLMQLGYVLVAVGVGVGLALGHSPSWFAAVGVPGNLLAIVGMVWLGIHGLARRSLPWWLAGLAIPTGLLTVLFAEFGTSLLAAGFWLLVVTRATDVQER